MIQKKIILKNNSLLGEFFTKYGIDTNVLIDLILYPHAKEYFKQRGYSFPDKFLCTLPQCLGETKGVLIHRYAYTPEKADQEIDTILKEFMIEKLPTITIEDDIIIIEEIGQRYGLNEEDIPLIYGFWKLKVNIIVVRDKAFENVSKELNINIIRWPIFR